MFTILISESTLEIVTALNDGLEPLIEDDNTFLVVDAGVPNRIITSDELIELRHTEPDWEMLPFAIWHKK